MQAQPKRGNEKLIQTIKKSLNRFDLTFTKKIKMYSKKKENNTKFVTFVNYLVSVNRVEINAAIEASSDFARFYCSCPPLEMFMVCDLRIGTFFCEFIRHPLIFECVQTMLSF